MPAFAYLRRSVSHDITKEPSYEAQDNSVHELAARHDDTELTILSDWGISGTKGPEGRPAYAALIAAIESGECSALYSYSLSRLGRSVPELARLIELCNTKNIPVRLVVDGVDTSTASGRFLTNILASVAAFEADVTGERIRAAIKAKKDRGDDMGAGKRYGDQPGEDLEAVIRAYEEAGSFSGAAKLLNEWDVRPRNGKKPKTPEADPSAPAAWWASSVSTIMHRVRPDLPRPSWTRNGAPSHFTLARLLRCPTCTTLLSGTRDRLDSPNKGRARYACRLGTVTPHERISISEHLILPAIIEEASRLQTPEATEAALSQDAQARSALAERRERVIETYLAGHLSPEERDSQIEHVNDQLRRLDDQRILSIVPRLNWEWPPEKLNPVLRALFQRIDLDRSTFQPVGYTWTVPEWRG